MAIADGRTTLEKVRASTNERQKVHRAKSESVTSRTEPDEILDAIAGGECRDSCVMRVMGGELAAERVTGSAKVDVEQHRKRMAALGDDAMPTEEEADESWQADLYDAACLLLEQMSDATRRRFFDKTTEMANEADDDARGTIAPPAQIEDNLFHHLDRMNHFAKVFKKHFKLSTFDREAKGRINTAIERTIQKWRSTQAALRGRINDIEREVLRDADDGAAS